MTKKKAAKAAKKTTKKKKYKPKLWGLEVNTFPRYAKQYMDYDYIENLDDKAKEFLSTFNDEYYGNTFRPRQSGEKTVHKRTKKGKRQLYQQTNERVRDMYTQRARVFSINDDYFEVPTTDNTEDYLVDYLDFKRDQENKKHGKE